MEDWMERQRSSREDMPRGPRTGFTEPAEERAREVVVHHETYVIFRPWQSCGRCQKATKENPDLLPEEGEYVCPHTRHGEYIRLVNRLRNAKANGPMKLSAREFSNERGELYVTIAWEEPEAETNTAKARALSVPRL